MFNQSHLDAFAAAIKNNYVEYCGDGEFSKNNPVYISFEEGKKYIRVVRSLASQRSCHSFIEIATGDVWKAASWKVPAKNKPRGNVTKLTPNIIQWTSAT